MALICHDYAKTPPSKTNPHPKICRACLLSSSETDIFNSISTTVIIDKVPVSVADLLVSCADITSISESDDYPQDICETCKDKAIISYEFRLQIERSDDCLRRPQFLILKDETVNKVSNEDDNGTTEVVTKIYQEKDHESSVINNANVIEYLDEKSEITEEPPPPVKNEIKVEIFAKGSSKIRTCNYCSFTAETLWEVHEHRDQVHSEFKSLGCRLCEEKFFRKFDLQNHHRTNHPDSIYTNKPLHYPCSECRKGFRSPSKLAEHFRKHTNIYPKKCQHCSFIAQARYDWKPHFDKNHPELRTEKCTVPECDKKFYNRASVLEHLRLYHSEAKIKAREDKKLVDNSCKICEKDFKCRAKLQDHMQSHTNLYPKKCQYCDFVAKTRHEWQPHYDVEHPYLRNIPCTVPDCTKKFYSRSRLLEHIRLYHKCNKRVEARQHICNICDKVYPRQSRLENHMKKAHEDPYPKKCPHCPFMANKPNEWGRHYDEEHSDLKSFHCDQCEEKFMLKSGLQEHVRKMHPVDTHDCKYCGKRYLYQHNLVLHLRTHSEDKPFNCTKCEKKFGSKTGLRDHVARHCNAKPYVCEFCGAAYSKNTNFQYHLSKHSGAVQPSFPCHLCGKEFVRKDALVWHIKCTHNMERNFICDVCGSPFLRAHHLKKHKERRHAHKETDETPLDNRPGDFYSFVAMTMIAEGPATSGRTGQEKRVKTCHLCGKPFGNSFCLKKHLRVTHPSFSAAEDKSSLGK